MDNGGELFVKGPNVMLGYLFESKPGKLSTLKGGWYDTGDIVSEDDEGRIQIQGRAKRFAKIAGEMISLAAVEDFIEETFPQKLHAIVARPDARKGEQLVLYTDCKDVTRPTLSAAAKEHGLSELFIPRDIVVLDKVPVLGTGKIDYQTLKAMTSE